MIRGKYLTSADDCAQVLALRQAVARAEGLKSGEDCHDRMAVYALAFDEDGAPAGGGRLYLDEDRFVIGCVGVLPARRKKGLGDLVMRMLIFRAQELNAPAVCALVRPGDAAFYARYGFAPEGEARDEWGQTGLLMRVAADGIAPAGCGGHGA